MTITLSSNFKKMTVKAIAAIITFIVVYLLLIVLGIILTIVCFFAGIGLFSLGIHVLTIVGGLGFIGMSLFVLFYLFKFIFSKHRVEVDQMIEITKKDEPHLFKFIDEIVVEVGTDFPKKVYLTDDVNASVFYDSSFLSMFLPTRKNLQIGMGLVNSVTVSEFKGILGHEFGHFSQRTMKVGSFVYNLNKVIYNLCYENDSFNNATLKWGNSVSYFSIFALGALKITEGIQWVLRRMYEVVNLSYNGLSREMEFYADAVSAHIAGQESARNALLRSEFAGYSYQSVLNFYSGKISANVRSKNIYSEQLIAMNYFAQENEIEVKNGLPLVKEYDLKRYERSKLVVEDQWSAHPSIADRVAALEKIKTETKKVSDLPATSLFRNAERTQEELTNKIFSGVTYEAEPVFNDPHGFQSEFTAQFQESVFPKIFHGYYDNHNPSIMEQNNLTTDDQVLTIEDLFHVDKVELIQQIKTIQEDCAALTAIQQKQLKVNSFDYDGIKYSSGEAAAIIKKLETELKELSQKLKENDAAVFQYFYAKAKRERKEAELVTLYESYFDADRKFDERYALYQKMQTEVAFMSETTLVRTITKKLSHLSAIEATLKAEIQSLLKIETLESDITQTIRDNFNKYLSKNLIYFDSESYIEDDLSVLFTAINDFAGLNSKVIWNAKVRLLNFMNNLQGESQKI